MTLRVLVTGYGGFLGAEVTRQLLAEGHQVRGLGRGYYPQLEGLPIDRIRGDITDHQTLVQATQGMDAVIHTAAKAGVWGDWNSYYSINTVGTKNVISACHQNDVKVLVYCSSPSVTFDGRNQSGIDESASYPQRWLCHYPHTKALGEQAILAAHQPPQLWTVALRPHLIWGEEDPHLFPRLIERAKRGRLRIIGSGHNRMDTVHVINAAAAHVQACEKLWQESRTSHVATSSLPTASGRAYFITQDDPVNCWDWVATVLDIAKVPFRRRHLSYRAAWHLGHALEIGYAAFRRQEEPPLTRFVAAQLACDHYFDITAAKTRLGYVPIVSNEQGLARLRDAWQ